MKVRSVIVYYALIIFFGFNSNALASRTHNVSWSELDCWQRVQRDEESKLFYIVQEENKEESTIGTIVCSENNDGRKDVFLTIEIEKKNGKKSEEKFLCLPMEKE